MRSNALAGLLATATLLAGAAPAADPDACVRLDAPIARTVPANALKLTEAVAAPRSLGARLISIFDVDEAAAQEATLGKYCAGKPSAPLSEPAGDKPSCERAELRIARDGSIQRATHTESGARTLPASWCLLPSEDWGARTIVALREAGALESSGVCFDAQPGVVYRGPALEEGELGRFRIWSARPALLLAPLQRATLSTAARMRDQVLRGWVEHRWMDAAYDAAAAADHTLNYEAFEGEICKAAERARVKLDCKSGAIRDTLERIKAAPFRSPPAADPSEVQSALCAYAADQRSTPVPGDAQVDFAIRAVALAHQPQWAQRLPYPWLAGELPLSSMKVVDLAAAGAADLQPIRLRPQERVQIFAHGLRAAGDGRDDSAALIKGKALEQEKPSDLARVFAAVLKVAFKAGRIAAPAAGVGTSTASCTPDLKTAVGRSCIADQAEGQLHAALIAEPDSFLQVLENLSVMRAAVLAKQRPNDAVMGLVRLRLREFIDDARFLGDPLLTTQGAPGAELTSRVIVSDALEGGFEYDARICRGARCDAETDKNSVLASRKLSVREKHRLSSTATELFASPVGLSDLPRGGYRFEPVGGASGPQVFYALREDRRMANHFTLTQLILLYPFPGGEWEWPERIAFGVGTTLFRDSEAELLQEWNFRAGFEAVRGLLITSGFSVRSVEVPTGRYRTGDLVAVDAADAKPPPFQHESRALWTFGVGLAIDLAILGDAANAIGLGDSSK